MQQQTLADNVTPIPLSSVKKFTDRHLLLRHEDLT